MLGIISLNISFILYLIIYLPQLIRNRRSQSLDHLSLCMHGLLFLGYTFDLIYGLSTHLPWQYITVSRIGLILLIIQHVQITKHLQTTKQSTLIKHLLTSLLGLGSILIYIGLFRQTILSSTCINILGWTSRLCFMLCFVPQLVKNHSTKTNDALSPYYLAINITVTCLDLISAWSLNWGWPNKIGPLISLSLLFLLCKQPTTNINRRQDAGSIS